MSANIFSSMILANFLGPAASETEDYEGEFSARVLESLVQALKPGEVVDTTNLAGTLTRYEEANGLRYIYEEDGEIVASRTIRPDGHHEIVVAPSARGRGIASHLVAEAAWDAWVRGVAPFAFVPPHLYSEGGLATARAAFALIQEWASW